MTRYNNYSGSGTGSSNDYDDTLLKLQKYCTIRATPTRTSFTDGDYGDKLIAGFDDVAVLDGIVFQRDDKPGTWKVFGFGQLGFNVGDDGGVYANYDADNDEFTNQMSAADVLDHARVQGFQETFGDDTYWYTPVGVVVEGTDDVAVNTDIIESPDTAEIPVGEVSMILGNKSWVRTLSKLLTETGDAIIATTTNGDGETVPVTESWNWLTTEDPQLRGDLDGRPVELFIIEETQTFGDDEVTYTTPILLDEKTDQRITIDNDASDLSADDGDQDEDAAAADDSDESDAEADPEPVAADGGATTESASESETDTSEPETADAPDIDADPDGLPDNVPDVLDDLVDYFARTQNGEVTPDEFRSYAASEVDDADSVDWEAAVAAAKARANA